MKLAVINRDNLEDHPEKNQARNTNFLRIQEDYITLVSERIEGRVTKKRSQSHFGRPVQAKGISSEPAGRGSLRTRSGHIAEFKQRKPGNEWESLPKWSSSWSGCLSEPDFTGIQPRWDVLQKPNAYRESSRFLRSLEELLKKSSAVLGKSPNLKLQTQPGNFQFYMVDEISSIFSENCSILSRIQN